jgi:8-oxo-dGTP pyrophosphatase MutT (NUDIX family)
MSPEFLRAVLARHEPKISPFDAHAERAAVALVLAGEGTATAMCFIRRAHREGDPWSGQMAFPGGKASAGDLSARAVAEREAFEEVGLVLGDSDWIGTLSELPVRRAGLDTDMLLSPFVYHLGRAAQSLEPNEEVAEAYWLPLEHLWDVGNKDRVEIVFPRPGHGSNFPAIRFRDQLIWGLSLRVLDLFASAIERPLPFELTAS